MRDSSRIRLTPSEYADRKQTERRRTLKELLAGLLYARERREEWYVWVTEGQPILTADQYATLGRKRATRRKSA